MEESADRISDLPDQLLEHILSFLRTLEAIRTSSLSKRWKDLWVSHPYISLSDIELTDDDDDPNNWSSRTTKFINTVDKLLLHRHGHENENAIIKKLQLSCRQGVGASEFARWYGAVFKDGLAELDLNFGRFCEKPLLSFLTSCTSLVTLKLNFGPLSGHKFPTSFDFPNLKSLQLKGFILAYNFPDQLSKCQNLENIVLYCFTCDDIFSSPYPPANQQGIILPNLKSAHIGCSDYAFRGRYDARIFLKNLITVLSKAKVFDLSLSIIEYLYTCIELNFAEQLPKFNNLKSIKIYLQAYQIGVMNYIFKKAPNLESLHIEFDLPYFVVGDYSELVLERLRSSCSRACLKVIRMTELNIEGRHQLQLVRLLFESAGFLEKITIELDKTAAKNPNLQCQRLSELPRLSKSCVLEMKWHNGSHTFT